ncbi:hypothetical protein GNI_170810 [Gregarina niphandrodes]|uniref:Uncharacterized protein n=1 Tax=Gregarina niphandrodes TaxID=110365 RepID=A0A023AXU1_GRENI|nr:hypothetical protein GNI_170810 [Gregarina niphandrodes]EZG43472.1 hypothetical protein GNI_170810 [Gregarina niphandrodes]|eukprot:XP_011133299.1 hypothetical protein GNI_170810 [Gregarina niphandrodes]
MLRTVTLDVSERVRVSLTYPGASKVVLAMNDDVQCAVSQPIVLELEPLRAAYESSNSEAKGGPPAGAGVPRMTAPLATAPLLGPSLRVDDELENAKMSAESFDHAWSVAQGSRVSALDLDSLARVCVAVVDSSTQESDQEVQEWLSRVRTCPRTAGLFVAGLVKIVSSNYKDLESRVKELILKLVQKHEELFRVRSESVSEEEVEDPVFKSRRKRKGRKRGAETCLEAVPSSQLALPGPSPLAAARAPGVRVKMTTDMSWLADPGFAESLAKVDLMVQQGLGQGVELSQGVRSLLGATDAPLEVDEADESFFGFPEVARWTAEARPNVLRNIAADPVATARAGADSAAANLATVEDFRSNLPEEFRPNHAEEFRSNHAEDFQSNHPDQENAPPSVNWGTGSKARLTPSAQSASPRGTERLEGTGRLGTEQTVYMRERGRDRAGYLTPTIDSVAGMRTPPQPPASITVHMHERSAARPDLRIDARLGKKPSKARSGVVKTLWAYGQAAKRDADINYLGNHQSFILSGSSVGGSSTGGFPTVDSDLHLQRKRCKQPDQAPVRENPSFWREIAAFLNRPRSVIVDAFVQRERLTLQTSVDDVIPPLSVIEEEEEPHSTSGRWPADHVVRDPAAAGERVPAVEPGLVEPVLVEPDLVEPELVETALESRMEPVAGNEEERTTDGRCEVSTPWQGLECSSVPPTEHYERQRLLSSVGSNKKAQALKS